jgi:hypothetical protein
MAAYLREIGLRFRALWGCAVMLVHHTGHAATERPRGSSAIRANVDYLLSVYRDEKEMMATLGCVKQKDGDLFRDAVFKLTVTPLGHDADGDVVTSLVARHLGTDDEVQQARQEEAVAGRGGRNAALVGLVTNGMPEKDLRRAFYEQLAGLDADAKKKAYYRARDRAMARLDRRWPGYGFAAHQGYPTAAHRAALARLGPCPHHRRGFGPVDQAALAI